MSQGDGSVPWWLSTLLTVGLVRLRQDGTVRWPVRWSSREWWLFMWRQRDFVGLFRNKPGVRKDEPGRWLPRRWGFYILGLEIGDRG
jgi:hypothetical protein